MVLEGKLQTARRCRLRKFRECFDKLTFSAQKIAQLLDEELLNQLRACLSTTASISALRMTGDVPIPLHYDRSQLRDTVASRNDNGRKWTARRLSKIDHKRCADLGAR
jgi:hypothetical protein